MAWQELINEFQQQSEQIELGGGERAIKRQHSKGRQTARERIANLLDSESRFLEVGLWAGFEMYKEWGGSVSASVITGVGTVSGR